MKARIFAVLALLLTPAFVFAGTTCINASPLTANGDSTKFDFVAASSANYYQFPVTAGHSYSFEEVQRYDDQNADLTLSSFTDTGCANALAGTVATTNANPGLTGNGSRFSFTAASNGSVFLKVANASGALGHYVDVMATDTTYASPRFSTTQGFLCVYGIQNTTNQVGHVTITATEDFNGTNFGNFGTFTTTLTIQPGTRALVAVAPGVTAPNLAVPANSGGFLNFTHDLPKNSFVIDGYFANASTLIPALIASPR